MKNGILYRVFLHTITHIVIVSFLTQNTVWAKGATMLMPETKLPKIIEAVLKAPETAFEMFKSTQLTAEELGRLGLYLNREWPSLTETARDVFRRLAPDVCRGIEEMPTPLEPMPHLFRRDIRRSYEATLKERGFDPAVISKVMNIGLARTDGTNIIFEQNDELFKAAADTLNIVLRKGPHEQITPEEVKAVLEYHERIHIALSQNRNAVRKVRGAIDSLSRKSFNDLFINFISDYGQDKDGDKVLQARTIQSDKYIDELIAVYWIEKILENPLEFFDIAELVTIDGIDPRIGEFIERHTRRLIDQIDINGLTHKTALIELINKRRAKRERERRDKETQQQGRVEMPQEETQQPQPGTGTPAPAAEVQDTPRDIHSVIEDFIAGNHLRDEKYPPFSYTYKMDKVFSIPFFKGEAGGKEYNLRMRKGLRGKFEIGTVVRVTSVFHEKHGWILKVNTLAPNTEEDLESGPRLYYKINLTENKMEPIYIIEWAKGKATPADKTAPAASVQTPDTGAHDVLKPELSAETAGLDVHGLKAEIMAKNHLDGLKRQTHSPARLWQIITTYNETLEKLQGEITWARKMRLLQERNYWRERLYDIFKDKNKDRRKHEWKEFAQEAGAPPEEVERAIYDFMLERHGGDLAAIENDIADNFKKLNAMANIENRVRRNRLVFEWYLYRALSKAAHSEPLDKNERHALIYEFVKGDHQTDKTFPAFSYRTKITTVTKPTLRVPFFHRGRRGDRYNLEMTAGVKEILSAGEEAYVESYFDEHNYGWLFRATNPAGRRRQSKKQPPARPESLSFIINAEKTKMDIIDPYQQSAVDSIEPGQNRFGRPSIPACALKKDVLDKIQKSKLTGADMVICREFTQEAIGRIGAIIDSIPEDIRGGRGFGLILDRIRQCQTELEERLSELKTAEADAGTALKLMDEARGHLSNAQEKARLFDESSDDPDACWKVIKYLRAIFPSLRAIRTQIDKLASVYPRMKPHSYKALEYRLRAEKLIERQKRIFEEIIKNSASVKFAENAEYALEEIAEGEFISKLLQILESDPFGLAGEKAKCALKALRAEEKTREVLIKFRKGSLTAENRQINRLLLDVIESLCLHVPQAANEDVISLAGYFAYSYGDEDAAKTAQRILLQAAMMEEFLYAELMTNGKSARLLRPVLSKGRDIKEKFIKAFLQLRAYTLKPPQFTRYIMSNGIIREGADAEIDHLLFKLGEIADRMKNEIRLDDETINLLKTVDLENERVRTEFAKEYLNMKKGSLTADKYKGRVLRLDSLLRYTAMSREAEELVLKVSAKPEGNEMAIIARLLKKYPDARIETLKNIIRRAGLKHTAAEIAEKYIAVKSDEEITDMVVRKLPWAAPENIRRRITDIRTGRLVQEIVTQLDSGAIIDHDLIIAMVLAKVPDADPAAAQRHITRALVMYEFFRRTPPKKITAAVRKRYPRADELAIARHIRSYLSLRKEAAKKEKKHGARGAGRRGSARKRIEEEEIDNIRIEAEIAPGESFEIPGYSKKHGIATVADITDDEDDEGAPCQYVEIVFDRDLHEMTFTMDELKTLLSKAGKKKQTRPAAKAERGYTRIETLVVIFAIFIMPIMNVFGISSDSIMIRAAIITIDLAAIIASAVFLINNSRTAEPGENSKETFRDLTRNFPKENHSKPQGQDDLRSNPQGKSVPFGELKWETAGERRDLTETELSFYRKADVLLSNLKKYFHPKRISKDISELKGLLFMCPPALKREMLYKLAVLAREFPRLLEPIFDNFPETKTITGRKARAYTPFIGAPKFQFAQAEIKDLHKIHALHNRIWQDNEHLQFTLQQMEMHIKRGTVYILVVNGLIRGVLLTYPLRTGGNLSVLDRKLLWDRIMHDENPEQDPDTMLFWVIGTDPFIRELNLGNSFIESAKEYFNGLPYLATFSPIQQEKFTDFENTLRILGIQDEEIKRYGIYLYLSYITGGGFSEYLHYISSGNFITPDEFFKNLKQQGRNVKYLDQIENFHCGKNGATIAKVLLYRTKFTRPDSCFTIVYGHKGFPSITGQFQRLNILNRGSIANVIARYEITSSVYPKLKEWLSAKDGNWKAMQVSELLHTVINRKMPVGYWSLVTAMRADGVIDEDDFHVIADIARETEKIAISCGIDTGNTYNENVLTLITEAISVDYLLQLAGSDNNLYCEFVATLKDKLKNSRYRNHTTDILLILNWIKKMAGKNKGVLSNYSHYKFIAKTADITGFKIQDICKILNIETKRFNIIARKRKKDDVAERYYKIIFEEKTEPLPSGPLFGNKQTVNIDTSL